MPEVSNVNNNFYRSVGGRNFFEESDSVVGGGVVNKQMLVLIAW